TAAPAHHVAGADLCLDLVALRLQEGLDRPVEIGFQLNASRGESCCLTLARPRHIERRLSAGRLTPDPMKRVPSERIRRNRRVSSAGSAGAIEFWGEAGRSALSGARRPSEGGRSPPPSSE